MIPQSLRAFGNGLLLGSLMVIVGNGLYAVWKPCLPHWWAVGLAIFGAVNLPTMVKCR